MSKEVADILRTVRDMLSVPGGRCINTDWKLNPNGGRAHCLGAAIGVATGHQYRWKGPAFVAVADVIKRRFEQGGFLPKPKFGAGGGGPRPWAEIYWPNLVLSITQFNNSTTDERVLELLDEVIAEQDPPKVPKPEGEQENAEPGQLDQPEEPDDPAADEDEPEAMKVRELEYA